MSSSGIDLDQRASALGNSSVGIVTREADILLAVRRSTTACTVASRCRRASSAARSPRTSLMTLVRDRLTQEVPAAHHGVVLARPSRSLAISTITRPGRNGEQRVIAAHEACQPWWRAPSLARP